MKLTQLFYILNTQDIYENIINYHETRHKIENSIDKLTNTLYSHHELTEIYEVILLLCDIYEIVENPKVEQAYLKMYNYHEQKRFKR